ncbi:MAG TPA: cyanophycin synthetase, partial [Pseudomonadales bacterium]|nr:cyanophycin synthetase [Pseudomonadales bacterium]
RATPDGWTFRGIREAAPIQLDGLALPSVALSNAATALQTLLLHDCDAVIAPLVRGASTARLPGRFEHFEFAGAAVIVDVAHNPHGASFLAGQLRETRRDGRTIAVAGFLQDKDAQGIVAALESQVDEWIFVETTGARGQTAAMAAARVQTDRPTLTAEAPFASTLRDLVGRLNLARDRIVVLGCFDLAQRARALLTSEVDDVD